MKKLHLTSPIVSEREFFGGWFLGNPDGEEADEEAGEVACQVGGVCRYGQTVCY